MAKTGNFEWDDAKDAANLRVHKLPLRVAFPLFSSVDLIEDIDDREDYGEERWIAVGRVGGRVLYCAYVWRGRVRRIISVRRATRREVKEFEEWLAEDRRRD